MTPPRPYARCTVCHTPHRRHPLDAGHPFTPGPNGRRPDPSATPDAMLISRAMATGRYRTREALAAAVAARCPAGVPLARGGQRREGEMMTAGAARRAMSRACVRPGALDEHWDLPGVMRAALEAIAAGEGGEAEQSTDGGANSF